MSATAGRLYSKTCIQGTVSGPHVKEPVMKGHFLWDIEVSLEARFRCTYITSQCHGFNLLQFQTNVTK